MIEVRKEDLSAAGLNECFFIILPDMKYAFVAMQDFDIEFSGRRSTP